MKTTLKITHEQKALILTAIRVTADTLLESHQQLSKLGDKNSSAFERFKVYDDLYHDISKQI